MKPRILTTAYFCFSIFLSNGQDLQNSYQRVLAENIIGKAYKFDQSTKKDVQNITILSLLGSVTTTKGQTLKILTYAFIWGRNSHTSGSILLFDKRNKYLGQFYLGGMADLPTKLKNGSLLFTNQGKEDCDKKLSTVINLETGIPKEIFIKCKGDSGDIYTFSNDK
jgi:hypothetical protein